MKQARQLWNILRSAATPALSVVRRPARDVAETAWTLLLGRMRGGLDPKRRAELLESFELDPRKKGRTYSKGNRQKVALVAAFCSDVELYLLDEPTSGLDPLMEAVFQDVVQELRTAGRSVLLSSHILSEVERARAEIKPSQGPVGGIVTIG